MFPIWLPQGWAARIDQQKFQALIARMSRANRPLNLPDDPGEGPESFNVPVDILPLRETLMQLYGQDVGTILRRVAAASVNKAATEEPGDKVLGGIWGIILAIAIPIFGVILGVWLVSYFTRPPEGPGGFTAR